MINTIGTSGVTAHNSREEPSPLSEAVRNQIERSVGHLVFENSQGPLNTSPVIRAVQSEPSLSNLSSLAADFLLDPPVTPMDDNT